MPPKDELPELTWNEPRPNRRKPLSDKQRKARKEKRKAQRKARKR